MLWKTETMASCTGASELPEANPSVLFKALAASETTLVVGMGPRSSSIKQGPATVLLDSNSFPCSRTVCSLVQEALCFLNTLSAALSAALSAWLISECTHEVALIVDQVARSLGRSQSELA